MGIVLGLLSGLSDSLKNVIAKRNTTEFHELIVTWAWLFFAQIFIAPFLLISGIPQLNATFWEALLAVTIIDVISYYLYTLSLKLTELSLSLPMLAFTPLFVLLSSIFINKELPGIWGILGVVLIVMGAYILNIRKNQDLNPLQPIRNLIQDKGSLYMLFVAIIWGVAGSLHKLAIDNAAGNSIFYSVASIVSVSIVYTVIVLVLRPREAIQALYPHNIKVLAPVGIMEGITVLTQMLTQGLSLATFAISLKRTSIVFSAVWGWKFFGENIATRLLPIAIIVFGVLLIAIDRT